MEDASEDEQEEDLLLLARQAADRETKVQREERLRQMMEVKGMSMCRREAMLIVRRAMEEEADVGEEEDDQASEPEPEPEPEPGPAPDAPLQPWLPPAMTSDGRRRGKRRVTKKKTVKDDEGYLGNVSAAQ